MGYPMTWDRVMHRNHLCQLHSYSGEVSPYACHPSAIAGDLRRLACDLTVPDQGGSWIGYPESIAAKTGLTLEQVLLVTREIFHPQGSWHSATCVDLDKSGGE